MTDQMHAHLENLQNFQKTQLRRLPFFMGVLFFLAAFVSFFAFSQEKELTMQLVEQVQSLFAQSGVISEEGGISFLGILLNNWLAMLFCILYGFLPFLFLPGLMAFSNGTILGLIAAWYSFEGLPFSALAAGVLPHAIFELPALFLAAACGVALCRNLIRLIVKSPKAVPIVEFLIGLMETVLFVIFPMVLLAAAVETYITPLIMSMFL